MKIAVTKCTFLKALDSGAKVYDLEWTQGGDMMRNTGQCFKEMEAGKEYEVTIEQTSYGKKVKFPNEKKHFGGGKPLDEYRIASFAMSYAKDMVVGSWSKPDKAEHLSSSDLTQIADIMFDYIKTHKV